MIKERYQFLYDKMQEYINERYANDALCVNEDILQQAVMDYFMDIYRLKTFHKIDRVNLTKIVAYEVYWILRRKPIQLVHTSENEAKYVFSNEGFLTVFIAHECLGEEASAPMSDEQERAYLTYLKHINYYLKYRNVDKQWLETNLLSIDLGKKLAGKT